MRTSIRPAGNACQYSHPATRSSTRHPRPRRPSRRPGSSTSSRSSAAWRSCSAFTARDTALTISQVADRTGLSRATARRLLLTLEQLGYVESNRREFSLTPAVLELAKPFAGPVDPWGFAKPYLQSLTDRLEESASIAVLDGTDILYVARTPTRRLMTLAVTVGSRLPAHATSKGRVLLAFLPEAELEAYFRRSAIERYTDRTVVDEAELRAILAGDPDGGLGDRRPAARGGAVLGGRPDRRAERPRQRRAVGLRPRRPGRPDHAAHGVPAARPRDRPPHQRPSRPPLTARRRASSRRARSREKTA